MKLTGQSDSYFPLSVCPKRGGAVLVGRLQNLWAPSKTEFAKNLWAAPLGLRIGNSEHWPDTLQKFSREHHTHIVLDDVRDLGWVGRVQDRAQGVWDEELEFGTTQGGTCAY